LINDNINTALGNKVDKVSGKGLSTNDFYATYKTNVDNLVSSTATTKNAHVHGNITSDGKVTTTTTNVSRVLVTDGDVVKSISKLPSSSVTHQDVSGKENSSNKVTSISSSSTDTQYPSAKAVYGYAQPKGNYLTSHNPVDTALSSNSTNAVQNKVINTALNNKINTSAIKNDLTTGGATNVLSAEQGKTLQNNKLDKSAYVVDTSLSSTSTNPVQNKVINTALGNKENSSNKVTSISSSSTDTQYPSAKAVYGYAQPKLSNSSWELVSNMNATNYYTNLRVYVNKYLRLGVAQIDSQTSNNCSLGAGNSFNFKIGSEVVSLSNNTVPSDNTIFLSPLATSYGLCHNTGKFIAKIDKGTGYVTLYNHSSSTDIEVHGSVYFRF
jgi:hypothetical protein